MAAILGPVALLARLGVMSPWLLTWLADSAKISVWSFMFRPSQASGCLALAYPSLGTAWTSLLSRWQPHQVPWKKPGLSAQGVADVAAVAWDGTYLYISHLDFMILQNLSKSYLTDHIIYRWHFNYVCCRCRVAFWPFSPGASDMSDASQSPAAGILRRPAKGGILISSEDWYVFGEAWDGIYTTLDILISWWSLTFLKLGAFSLQNFSGTWWGTESTWMGTVMQDWNCSCIWSYSLGCLHPPVFSYWFCFGCLVSLQHLAWLGGFLVLREKDIKVPLLDVVTFVLLLADFLLDIDVVLTKIQEIPNTYIGFLSALLELWFSLTFWLIDELFGWLSGCLAGWLMN